MSKSLEDQFKELGLANEKQVRKARQGKKKKKGKGKPAKNEAVAPDPNAEAAQRERAEKAERDRRMEAERQAERRARESAARVRQIVETNRVEREKGDVAYHFTCGSRIKEVALSKAQHRRLAEGEIGLVALGNGYELVPRATAERIREIDADAVLVLNSRSAASDDDPYADFPVPDDLMW
jgi:uncharacterized protein YaiL (DUF2058 family)